MTSNVKLESDTRHSSLVARHLPHVRGQLRFNANIARNTWFQVGGCAEILFKPADVEDLAHFLTYKPKDVPMTVIGVGSNLLVRDGGVDGVVVRLGRGFTTCHVSRDTFHVEVGAACLDVHVAQFAADHGMAGMEFLSGIPGTIGGAVAMNGGAYGNDISNILLKIEVVDEVGNIQILACEQLGFTYRHSTLPKGAIVTRAVLKGAPDHPEAIRARMRKIHAEREATQPVRTKTGGSTFKNPPGYKAWQLIDESGCRGLTMGGAQVSPMHCNFLINTGNATAADLENLGEEVRRRVREHSGVELEWEIRRIGKFT